jgi:hypothetical protein
LDDTSGGLLGSLYLDSPEAMYNVQGGCAQTDVDYADFWFTLVPGGTPYRGAIYVADDGQIYIEGEQDGTGIHFVLQRQ